MNIPVVIIEDEIGNQKLLTRLIQDCCPNLVIQGYAEKVQDSIDLIRTIKPQIIFLDIQLKDGTGFDVLDKLNDQLQSSVIFTTAFDKYAIDAFKYSAVNYLLKPIEKEGLIQSVERAISIQNAIQMNSVKSLLDKMVANKEEKMITISSLKSTEFIRISDIVHIEAQGSYSKIFLEDGTDHLVSKVMKTYIGILADHNFFRAHQSHLINLKFVKKMNRGDNTVVLSNGTEISLARNRKDDFFKAMERLML